MMHNILSQDAFWIVNKKVSSLVGVEAALLLSDLITKRKYFEQKKGLIDDGWFFNTALNIEADTFLSPHKQRLHLKVLSDAGFIETKRMGLPAKLHFKIFDNKLLNFLTTGYKEFEELYNKNKLNKNKYNKSIAKKEILATKKKQTDPLFQPFRKTFEQYYSRLGTGEYYWNVKDSVAINKLIKQVLHAYRTAAEPKEPTPDEMVKGFEAILTRAIKDDWIKNNFELSIVSSKFNNFKINKNATERSNEVFAEVLRKTGEEFPADDIASIIRED